ncbi:MAG: UvrD-helicase domain-containing protein [Candidatus Gracilibacteria bacterium]
MTFEEAYESLNEEQKAAVDQTEGPVMVLAGPGTGKTQMIALRIAQILRKTQAAPYNILCLTFTESGAVAMRKRLLEFIGETAYGVRIHTFHSFCNEVIQDYPTEFLFARELSALTEVERIQFFHELLDRLAENTPLRPFGSSYFYLKDIVRVIQDLKRENISPEKLETAVREGEALLNRHKKTIENFVGTHANQLKAEDFERIKNVLAGTPFAAYLDGPTDDKKERTLMKSALKEAFEDWQKELPKQLVLCGIYENYQELLHSRGRYDFEDMLTLVTEKLKQNPELRAHYQEQFQYILVDEYQDTNNAQNEVVRLLGEFFENPNIFVVGDDKQSIYRFQGASLENLLFFYQLYKKSVQVVTLRENYRSQQNILDAAHSLITHNEQSLAQFLDEKFEALHANASHPILPVRIAELDTADSEHYFLAKETQRLLAEGTKPSEIAILYRNNREADGLVGLFLRMGIPFHLSGGHDLLSDKEIQKLLTLMRTLADLEDEFSLFTILHYDFFDFDSLSLAKLSHDAHTKHASLIETMKETEIFAEFADKFLYWHKQSLNLPLIEFFDLLIKESGYLDHLLKKENQLEELNRLNSLFAELKHLNKARTDTTLADFLVYVDLLKENNIALPEQELVTQKDAVHLMTAHRSKGQEFEHVFVMNAVDKQWGNTPDRAKIQVPPTLLKVALPHEKNEDERRLFFVALTRAKKSVTLSYPKQNAEGRPTVPSMFVNEIAPAFKETISTQYLEQEALQHLQTIFLVPKPSVSEDHKAYIKSLLQNYILNVTHLNNYLRCPRLFYYQNILRVPQAKNKHLAFGTAIHESLKDLQVGIRSGTIPEKALLLEQFEKHLKREILSQQDFRGSLELGQRALNDYYDTYRDTFHPNVLLEYDFRPHGVSVNGVPITGKLDKIELKDEAERTVHVVDYKTGNPDSKAQALGPQGEYRRQIIFYKLLCDNSKKFPYTMVSGEIDFVQKNKAGAFVRKIFHVTPEETENLKTQIQAVYQDIMSLRFLDPDEFETCGECEWCKQI